MLKEKILAGFCKAAEATEAELVPDLADDTPLLETGLDSLGFAVLVAILEEDLGLDPFSEATEAYYPETVADFVTYYEKHRASSA